MDLSLVSIDEMMDELSRRSLGYICGIVQRGEGAEEVRYYFHGGNILRLGLTEWLGCKLNYELMREMEDDDDEAGV